MYQAAPGGGIHIMHGPDAALEPWPIPKNQVLAGSPQAAGAVLWQSDDKRLLNGIWECTPGEFTWDYTWDETAYFFEGRFTLTDEDGHSVSLGAGDLGFVKAGTRSTWRITETVRKAFHVRSDTPVEL